MRGLAAELDVSPNAIYSHVESRSDLIDAVLDDVLGGVAPPDPSSANWRAELESVMDSTYEVLLDNERLVPLYAARYASGGNARALGERMLELLGRGGVDERRANEALRVLIVYTVGFAAFATRPVPAGTNSSPPVPKETQSTFESGLRWILAGIAGRG